MGLILDLTVAALALVVIGSLATLAWTLAVSAVHATRRGRAQVAAHRASVAEAEARLPARAAKADAALVAALGHTTSQRPAATTSEPESTTDDGERPAT